MHPPFVLLRSSWTLMEVDPRLRTDFQSWSQEVIEESWDPNFFFRKKRTSVVEVEQK